MSGHGHNEPVKSEPVVGHGGTAYEGHDVEAGTVIWSLTLVAGLAALGFILMFAVQKYFEHIHPPGELASPLSPDRVLAPAPQLQVHPWEELPDVRAREKETLEMTGKDKLGRLHIPIDSAMNEVISRLKIQPGAPAGLTTPGGQGREFSHSLAEMPTRYRPQIQGEIRKNAQ